MDVSENVEVPDWAEVCLLRFCDQRIDCVVVEGYFLYTELDFAGFYLNAGFGAGNDENSEQDEELVDAVGTSSEIIAVGGVLVTDRVAKPQPVHFVGVQHLVGAVETSAFK